jgi:SMI1 / KNR4 family (SUKH-1)
MSSETISMLRHVDGVVAYQGISPPVLRAFEHEAGMALPSDYSALLSASNGLTVSHGYCRLFGIGNREAIDAVAWNRPECWRFAWDDRCSPFWCFGETGWGDQYAYNVEDLKAGRVGPVYLLEGLALTPEIIAHSFIDFLFREVVRSAVQPYHTMTRLAQQRFGPLPISSHVIYSPSPLLGSPDIIDNVQVMDAVAAMIIQGDIATQIDNAPAGKRVSSVEPYQDEQSRMRLRLIWEPV